MKKLYRPILYGICGIAGLWLLLKFFLPVGLPFLLGWLLSALAVPCADRLTSGKRVPRCLVSFLCITLLTALFLLVFWLLARLVLVELEHLGNNLPEFLDHFSDAFGQLQEALLGLTEKLPENLASAARQWIQQLFEGSSVLVSSASEWLLGLAAAVIGWLPSLSLFLLATILSAYFFTADAPKIKSFFKTHIPEAWRVKISSAGSKLKAAFLGYLKAQGRLALVTFVITFAGLLFLHPANILLLTLLIVFVDALPVFGAGTILLPWAIFCLLGGNTITGLGLLLLYGADSLTRTILEPRFIGRQIGLPPLLTLFSLYAGFRLFGIPGMILLPIAAILVKQLYDILETD